MIEGERALTRQSRVEAVHPGVELHAAADHGLALLAHGR